MRTEIRRYTVHADQGKGWMPQPITFLRNSSQFCTSTSSSLTCPHVMSTQRERERERGYITSSRTAHAQQVWRWGGMCEGGSSGAIERDRDREGVRSSGQNLKLCVCCAVWECDTHVAVGCALWVPHQIDRGERMSDYICAQTDVVGMEVVFRNSVLRGRFWRFCFCFFVFCVW